VTQAQRSGRCPALPPPPTRPAGVTHVRASLGGISETGVAAQRIWGTNLRRDRAGQECRHRESRSHGRGKRRE